jgi:hypothetical protein
MLKRNGNVATRDDQLSLFDFGRPNGQRNLSHRMRLMAERHWRKFRPNMVRELEAKGMLMEALFEAQERASEEMEAVTRQFETEQKLTPQ